MEPTPSWCQPTPISHLHETCQTFLNQLNLSLIHPSCTSGMNHNTADLTSVEEKIDLLETLLTLYHQSAPALLAMLELWLRLFAFFISPLCISYLIHNEMTEKSDGSSKPMIFGILACISSAVLFMDSAYIFEYGHSYGMILFGVSTVFFLRNCFCAPEVTHGRRGRILLAWALALLLVTLTTYTHQEPLPAFAPGLYHSNFNPRIQQIVRSWPLSSMTYDSDEGGTATPFLLTGDARTGIPFLINPTPPLIPYTRVWLPSSIDSGEAIALDIAFPPRHSIEMPLYLVLHGLNGGSHEEYVRDFANRRIAEGSTVVIMIARGMMDTPVHGYNVFHGARIGDVADAASLIASRAKSPHQVFTGVGYSMGGIILANYVARTGEECPLDAAAVVSGALDMRAQLDFWRSRRLWQPILTIDFRNILVGKHKHKYKTRLSYKEFLDLICCTSLVAIDEYAVVKYHNFNNITHYYSEMSAMGDYIDHNNLGRITNVSIPLLVVHALDDPLLSWRTLHNNPNLTANSGSGNLLMLITRTGGHVGWPMGLNPTVNGWRWMNDVVRDFILAVDSTK